MAENKKSFVLYSDLIHTVRKMKKEDAGELLLHILSYVNDEDPVTDNIVVDLTFEPIKQQFKRDLKKWELTLEKRSNAGKASAEARKKAKITEQKLTKSTHVESVQQNSTHSTVNDNVNVNVNVNDNVIQSTNVDVVDKEKFDDDFQNFKILFYKNLSDDFDFVFEIQKIKNQLDQDNSEPEKNYLSQMLNFLISEKRKKVAPKKENQHIEYIEELKSSPEWLDLISIQNKNIQIEAIISKLDEFNTHLKTDFKIHQTKTEFVSHFKSWLPKKIPDKPNQVLTHNR